MQRIFKILLTYCKGPMSGKLQQDLCKIFSQGLAKKMQRPRTALHLDLCKICPQQDLYARTSKRILQDHVGGFHRRTFFLTSCRSSKTRFHQDLRKIFSQGPVQCTRSWKVSWTGWRHDPHKSFSQGPVQDHAMTSRRGLQPGCHLNMSQEPC